MRLSLIEGRDYDYTVTFETSDGQRYSKSIQFGTVSDRDKERCMGSALMEIGRMLRDDAYRDRKCGECGRWIKKGTMY